MVDMEKPEFVRMQSVPYVMLKPHEVRVKLQEGIAQLEDLFGMDLDSLIIVARHYNWN